MKLLRVGGSMGDGSVDLLGILGSGFHAVFEGPDAFAQPLTQLRELLGTENKQRNR